MSSRFFDYINNLVAFRRAKASDVAVSMQQLDAGLAAVAGEIDRTLRGVSTEPTIAPLPLRELRRNKGAGYDDNGDPAVVTIASEGAMQAAISAANTTTADRAAVAATAASICGPVVRTSVAAIALGTGVTTTMEFAGKVLGTLPSPVVDGAVVCVVPCNGRRDNEIVPSGGAPINGIAGENYVIDSVVTHWFKFISGQGWWRI